MVRDSRIKEYIFSAVTADAATTGSQVSNHALNGEVLSVDWQWNRTGSIFLTAAVASGTTLTGEEFFRRNAPSGTGTQYAHPRIYESETTGVLSNGSVMTPFIINAPLVLNYAGLASGTQTLKVSMRYR